MKIESTSSHDTANQTGRPARPPRRVRRGLLSGGLPLANAAALLPSGGPGVAWTSGAHMHTTTLSGQWGLLPAVVVGTASIALLIRRRVRTPRSDRTAQ